MEFLLDYLGFILKTATIVAAILVIFGTIVSGSMRKQQRGKFGQLNIRHVNDIYEHMRSAMEQAVMRPEEFKKTKKIERKTKKQELKAEKKEVKKEDDAEKNKRNMYVMEFQGDIQASQVENLRNEISAVLTHAKEEDEVLVRVESAGGLVHSYGYAASQLLRVKKAGLKLTVAVDKVAASGGYMLAVVADSILAAPFALVGSIGVAAEIPNVNRLLKKHDVDYEVITAGEFKRTLSIFGENTDSARTKFTEEIEDVHTLFKEFVQANREHVDMETVATGEAWYGERARAINLVDELKTSDEYIMDTCKDAEVYEVTWDLPKKPIRTMISQSAHAVTEVWNWIRGKIT